MKKNKIVIFVLLFLILCSIISGRLVEELQINFKDYKDYKIEIKETKYSENGLVEAKMFENGNILEFKRCEGNNKEQAEILMNEYEKFLEDIRMTNKSLIEALK